MRAFNLGRRDDKCVTLGSSGNFTCAHHVIHTGPSARTVLIDGGVPFTSATWVTAVVRFAPDSIAAGPRQRFPGPIPAGPLLMCGVVYGKQWHSQAVACAPGLLTAAHVSSNLC